MLVTPQKMEAAGIEPASRDVSGQASTCVVESLNFAPGDRHPTSCLRG